MKNDSGIKGDFPDVADTDEEGSGHVSWHLAWRKVLTAQVSHTFNKHFICYFTYPLPVERIRILWRVFEQMNSSVELPTHSKQSQVPLTDSHKDVLSQNPTKSLIKFAYNSAPTSYTRQRLNGSSKSLWLYIRLCIHLALGL